MGNLQTAVRQYEMLIDGELVTGSRFIPVLNPATEQVISEIPEATEQDVNAAVMAAKKAQSAWSTTACDSAGRAICHEIATVIRAKEEAVWRTLSQKSKARFFRWRKIEVEFLGRLSGLHGRSLRDDTKAKSFRAIGLEKTSCSLRRPSAWSRESCPGIFHSS